MISIFRQRALNRIPWMCQIRSGGHWNRDWKPGKFPVTCEQYESAAEKYNILPQEYQPFRPSHGIDEPGDYPKLPDVSVENKDIYYPWDLPDVRRNFGEPIHFNGIWYGEQRCDTHALQKHKYSELQMFLSLVAATAIVYIIVQDRTLLMFPAVAARHYPKPGVIHYSYEPAK